MRAAPGFLESNPTWRFLMIGGISAFADAMASSNALRAVLRSQRSASATSLSMVSMAMPLSMALASISIGVTAMRGASAVGSDTSSFCTAFIGSFPHFGNFGLRA
jgi:hypothetical protein